LQAAAREDHRVTMPMLPTCPRTVTPLRQETRIATPTGPNSRFVSHGPREIADEYGYDPNLSARALVSKMVGRA
jgi:hypothetical protein